MSLFIALALTAGSSNMPQLTGFQQRCETEGLRLWGETLCAPVVVVDPATGSYETSQPAPSEPLPKTRANSSIKWGGKDWVMVLAPLPVDAAARDSLLFHEAWHVRQAALGFRGNMAVAAHLEEPTPRYLLRLEWAALEKALRSTGAQRRRHAAQALAFRRQRLSGPIVAKAERDQMLHEGLAAYTGAAASGDTLRLTLADLEGGGSRAALARSFAYVSGPAWGLLLDRLRPGWRSIREEKDLPDLLPVAPATIARADDYGGTAILLAETQAAVERNARLQAALAATAEGKALMLPLKKMNMDFDPNRVIASSRGTIYQRITVGDAWGRISLDGVPLRIAEDFKAAYAPWPLPEGALTLSGGWRVEALPNGGARLVPPA